MKQNFKNFICRLAILILLTWNGAVFATPNTNKIIMSYWYHGKKYFTYPIPGSLNSEGIIQTNDNLSEKLNYINVFAYAFLQVNNKGYIYFKYPSRDLSKQDIDTFCRFHASICFNVKSKKSYLGNFDAFSKLNNKHQNLKKIVSIGGEGSRKSFTNAINHPNIFIESVKAIIKVYQLNGIDLDFELYTPFTKTQADRYADLVQALRKKLGNDYFISLETTGDYETIGSIGSKNWIKISKNAYVCMMGYGFHDYLDSPHLTGNNSNLYSDPNEPNVKGFYHISDDQAVKYLTYLGVPVNKIILGYPAFFEGYGGVDSKNKGLYQSFDPKITPSFNLGKGKGTYSLVSNLFKKGFISHVILMNDKVSAVYAYNPKNKTWISYENNQSVVAKMDYVNKNNLAGMMMWNIEYDLPANNPYSLLANINRNAN